MSKPKLRTLDTRRLEEADLDHVVGGGLVVPLVIAGLGAYAAWDIYRTRQDCKRAGKEPETNWLGGTICRR